MSLLRRAAGNLRETRASTWNPAQQWGSTTPPSNGQLGTTAAGTVVSEKTALEIAAVFGSVSVLADAVSTLPIRQFRKVKNGPDVEVTPSPVIAQPFVEISAQDWFVQGMVSLALRGNAYLLVISRDPETLLPSQLKPIHPDQVRVRRLTNGTIEYRVQNKVVPVEDIKHLRNLQVPGALIGLNPVEYLRNILGLARGADLWGGAYFSNSAIPGGIIEVDGSLSPEETTALKNNWLEGHQGIGAAHLPGILTEGAKYQPIPMTNDDAQFIASRAFSQAEISGMIFRVPPHMIGIVDRSTSWGAGIEQQELGFVRNTVGGYLLKFETVLSACVPPGQIVKFDLTERLRGDMLTRYQAHMLGRTMGIETIAGIRDDEDLPPLDTEKYPYVDDPMAPLNSAQAVGSASMAPAASTKPPSSGSANALPELGEVRSRIDEIALEQIDLRERVTALTAASRNGKRGE